MPLNCCTPDSWVPVKLPAFHFTVTLDILFKLFILDGIHHIADDRMEVISITKAAGVPCDPLTAQT